VGRVTDWLRASHVDVLLMQEIKCKPEQFPRAEFEALGYELAIHGLNQWNGVAIASKVGIADVEIGFPGMPGFSKNGEPEPEARAIGATVGGVKAWSLYVPNGRALDDPHYTYKLEWLAALREYASEWNATNSEVPLALGGDWNIAPTDADNGDPDLGPGSTHISAPEREVFASFFEAGFTDPVREFVPTGYTYWDYQRLKFPKNEGIRIDFIIGNQALKDRSIGAWIDRDERKGDGPSDHVPVVLEITDRAVSGDSDFDFDEPMVF